MNQIKDYSCTTNYKHSVQSSAIIFLENSTRVLNNKLACF